MIPPVKSWRWSGMFLGTRHHGTVLAPTRLLARLNLAQQFRGLTDVRILKPLAPKG